MTEFLLARENFKDVFHSRYLDSLSVIVTRFTELIQNILNEVLTLSLYRIKKSINRMICHIPYFEMSVNKINRNIDDCYNFVKGIFQYETIQRRAVNLKRPHKDLFMH